MKMAGVTRLELATSGVTGRRSNQTELHPRDFSVGPSRVVRTEVHRIHQGFRVNKYPGAKVDNKWWAMTAVTFPINPSTY